MRLTPPGVNYLVHLLRRINASNGTCAAQSLAIQVVSTGLVYLSLTFCYILCFVAISYRTDSFSTDGYGLKQRMHFSSERIQPVVDPNTVEQSAPKRCLHVFVFVLQR